MMKIYITIAFSCTSIFTCAQNSKSQRLDSLFTSWHTQQKFNGNVLVAEKGEILFQKSYGLADEETKHPLNNQTVFELASLSKQFTAMGIVQLQKQGKLNYSDPMSKYIPELKFYGNISIHNLLVHTGGLPDYMEIFEEKWDKSKFATNNDIVNELGKHQPKALFQPGEKFEYSNTGYALLALIIERISQKSYGDYLHDVIFKPLGMKNTFVHRRYYKPKKIENYAYGYIVNNLGKKVLPDTFGKQFYTYYLDGIVGDGMVNSTTEDLLLWDRALYDKNFLNDEDKALIFSPSKTTTGSEVRYGYGWAVGTHPKYGKIANHTGHWGGYITMIERVMDHDKTIIMLQNNATDFTINSTASIKKILFNKSLPQDKRVDLKPEELDNYTGTFYNSEYNLTIKIFREGSQLFAQAEGQSAFPLESFENHLFKFEPSSIRLTFDQKKRLINYEQGKYKFTLQKK